MSSLTEIEKIALDDLLGLSSGYVLGNTYSDRTFAEFFRNTARVNIDAPQYMINGGSKGKRFRAFCELESDALVGKVLEQLLGVWAYQNADKKISENKTYIACHNTVARLQGKPLEPNNENEFLEKDFGNISIKKLAIESALHPILEKRLKEVEVCLKNGSSLAAVILSGSILEGILLGTAIREPGRFNQTNSSPKDKDGKVLLFDKWTLGHFIDASYELGFLKLDIKKYSHSLRDFRNYIHPYAQMASGFNPDTHTAKISLQVLKAAIADLSGERT